MHILDSADTARLLSFDDLVPAVAHVARQMAQGKINAPERQVVTIDEASVLLSMPAIAADLGVTKLITVHNNNARHHLPAIQGEVIVFDTQTGRRLALLDGPTVTARRTAAVTLLGIQQLAPATPKSALLIGTGVQATAHAEALHAFFGITEFCIASRDSVHAQRFCDALALRGVNAEPVDAKALPERCQATDLVIALTTATEPVIPAQLPAQTLAIGVGAFKPQMAEFPAALLHARPIVVDHLDGARHEAGDLLRANVDWSSVRDLARVLGEGIDKNGPTPVLKTVGHAAWDLAAARVAVAALM